MLVNADVVSQFMMCINRTHVYVWFSRDRAYRTPRSHSTKNARIRVFFFYFFFHIEQDSSSGWKKRFPPFPPVSLHASNAVCCVHLWRIAQARHARMACNLRAACRIFFYPLQTYVRYVSKSPPATSPSLIKHGTHDCTIKPPIVRPLATSRKKLHR